VTVTLLDHSWPHVSPALRGNHIGGAWREAAGGARLHDENPGDTADSPGDFASSDAGDAHAAVAAALAAERGWRALGAVPRGEILARAAAAVRDRARELARAVTWENGKTAAEAEAEVARAADHLAFYAAEGRRLDGALAPADDPAVLALAERVPVGVSALITPFNFPLAIPAWKIGAALVSGCTAVWKPSPLTPLSAALLMRVLEEAGLPEGVLNLLQGDAVPAGALVGHAAVRAVSFTGSYEVGMRIRAATSDRLVRTQLELGGNNALVVLADADLEAAADAAVGGAFGQAGQRCSATSRLIVDTRVKRPFLELVEDRARALRVGYGIDPRTDMGPLIDARHVRLCEDAVGAAVSGSARLVCGGRRPAGDLPPGHYFTPTVLADVDPASAIAAEEVFGPVLSVIDCRGTDEAVRIVNRIRYGMSATVFTADTGRALGLRDELEAGMLHINRPGTGAFPHLPHVGAKDSQHGPAECGRAGLDFYTQWRTTCARLPRPDRPRP